MGHPRVGDATDMGTSECHICRTKEGKHQIGILIREIPKIAA